MSTSKKSSARNSVVNTLRTLIVAALLLEVCSGCSSENKSSEGFENFGQETSLPEGWELKIHSGDYRLAKSAESREGKAALAFAGSGGSAELIGAEEEIKSKEIAIGHVWIKPKEFQSGTAELGFRSVQQSGKSEFDSGFLVNSEKEGWLDQHFFFLPAEEGREDKIQPYVKLDGEGLVLLDALEVERMSIDESISLKDGSFESPDAGGNYSEWDVYSDKDLGSSKALRGGAFDGATYVQLKGNGRWGVMITKAKMNTSKNPVVVAFGYARATRGKARLKLEYFRGDNNIGSTYSNDVTTNSWQPLSVMSDAKLVEECQTMKLTLAGEYQTREGYSVEFDKISLVSAKR